MFQVTTNGQPECKRSQPKSQDRSQFYHPRASRGDPAGRSSFPTEARLLSYRRQEESAAPRAASHLLSTLFPRSWGEQEEEEISGRKIRTAGENVNAYRPRLPFPVCSQKWEQKARRQIEVTPGFPATHPSQALQPCPQRARWEPSGQESEVLAGKPFLSGTRLPALASCSLANHS